MIVYGSRATVLKTQLLFEPCPNCKATNSVQMNVLARYAHIFWVPMFPIGRYGVSVCTSCGQKLKVKHMPPELRLTYDNVKIGAGVPFWYFSGLGVIALIIIGLVISDKQKDAKISKQMLEPKAGDIYEIKIKDEAYTLYKITRVQNDTVYFIMNQFEANQETGISDLYLKPFDSSATYGYPRNKLNMLSKKFEIIDIVRH